ncbi:YitT family protein [Agromyces mangrovi Wang et al. 2018]|uniref:YitT family protein n=1 Tax=Agromyces mangrovi TaxID=1858653 RepID=UPI0025726A2D|nr:YitT family protein [Agromyces mangrovi]
MTTDSRPAADARPADAPAAPAGGPAASVRHSFLDDLTGMATGVFVASLGLFLLNSAQMVTGGTAGLSLLIGYVTGIPFGIVFLGVNLPFFVLAALRKGWRFTVKTAIAIVAVSALSSLHPLAMPGFEIDPLYGAIAGNLLAGIGLLVLFRHGASLGGYNVVALLAQERLGWRAGYVQMAFDLVTVLAAIATITPLGLVYSLLGAALLNLVLALNHRPGRYFGA